MLVNPSKIMSGRSRLEIPLAEVMLVKAATKATNEVKDTIVSCSKGEIREWLKGVLYIDRRGVPA